MRVDILDSATLQRLQSLAPPWEKLACDPLLAFSPDSRGLTYSGRSAHLDKHRGPFVLIDEGMFVVTWDLQTGGVVSAIEWSKWDGVEMGSEESGSEESGGEESGSEEWYTESEESDGEGLGAGESDRDESEDEGSDIDDSGNDGLEGITYSTNGRMVALLTRFELGKATIDIFDVASGVYMHYLRCPQLEDSRLCHIWTHGESLRFVTAEPTGIAIWEVGFTPGATATEIKTFPAPDNVSEARSFEFLPALDRAVFIYSNHVLIWDARDSKTLLNHAGIDYDSTVTLSPDGRFFACSTAGSEFWLWRESPTGYILHGKFSPNGNSPEVLFSQSSKSFVTFHIEDPMVQLWQMSSSISTSSDTLVQPLQQIEDFVLEFLPDRSLAVVVQQRGSVVTILDLKSSALWLTIETPMEVYGLGVIKNSIAAIGSKKAITWILPEGGPLPDVRLNVEDSTQTVNFINHPWRVSRKQIASASISPDSRYIALIMDMEGGYMYGGCLCLYSASTGQYFARISTRLVGRLWFTPGGDNIWCAGDVDESRADVWTITGDVLDHIMVVVKMEHKSWKCPWGSSEGYQVTKDGWILGLDGKQLLMLPPPWQSGVAERAWNGQFLALLHASLTEPVIIELGL